MIEKWERFLVFSMHSIIHWKMPFCIYSRSVGIYPMQNSAVWRMQVHLHRWSHALHISWHTIIFLQLNSFKSLCPASGLFDPFSNSYKAIIIVTLISLWNGLREYEITVKNRFLKPLIANTVYHYNVALFPGLGIKSKV